jgi:glycerol-3-phosphate dehydrogenase
MELVRGSHIIVDRMGPEGPALAGFYYVESPKDGRAVFVMPWKGKVLVGTTEGRYRGDPDEVRPLPHEIHYLTEILTHYFPLFKTQSTEKLPEAFAGLRVLPSGEGHVFHRSRELILHPDRPASAGPLRLLTLYGGKLTVWRATGEQAMKVLAPSLPRVKPRARTSRLPLSLNG